MSDSRPRLLFLSQTLPYPPDRGVKLRTYNVLRQLATDFDVTALCFYRRRTTRDPVDAVAGLRDVADVHAFPIQQEHSRARLVADHARSILSGTAYTEFAYRHAAALRAVDAAVAGGSHALAHVDSLDLSAYLPRLGRLPVACTHHNVESELLRRAAETEASGLRRAYFRRQADLLDRVERRWYARVALNVAVSERDAAHIRRVAPASAVHVAPNGVDTNYFTPLDCEQEGLVFVGGASWFPNLDAMRFLAEAILPRIRREEPGVTMRWIGRIDEPLAAWAQTQGIEPVGYVDDVRPWLARAAVFVAPLRVGGGTRVKILDAWGMGKAIVSTTVGAEGLSVEPERNIVLRDDPEAFAAACVALLRDANRRAALSVGARKTAVTAYDWSIIGARLRRAYHDLLGAVRA